MNTPIEIQIKDRKVKLTNLDKVLYPKAPFTKAQVLEYYSNIAPVILRYLKNRPVTLKRYPDGVDGKFFYQKNCPTHRPDWLATAEVPGQTSKLTQYCLLNDRSALLWSANLAAIELHPLLSLKNRPDRPTMMVFDLDPGPGRDLTHCARAALLLQTLLRGVKLEAWVKTSGSKGLHLYVPLNTSTTFSETKTVARAISETLQSEYPSELTMTMRKSERRGKVFMDWSQNDDHKTTVCVYSLRATPEPRVSTPLTWEEVKRLARGKVQPSKFQFGPKEVLKRIEKLGDLFEPILKLKQRLPPGATPNVENDSATSIRRSTSAKNGFMLISKTKRTSRAKVPRSKNSSAPSALKNYWAKRDFNLTPEPRGSNVTSESSRFVVQKHKARSLHYDFRIEVDDVLKSWAVPKGPSTNPAVQRLAVRTEDHPLEYGDFEGTIPAGQYGAGTVLLWDQGTYRNLKLDDRGKLIPLPKCLERGNVEIGLDGRKLKGGYRLIRTSSGPPEQWLFRKMADDHADSVHDITQSMPRSVTTGRDLLQIAATPKGRAKPAKAS